MELRIKRFNELTTDELYDILGAREAIFTLEKGMHCRDIDGMDKVALHALLTEEDRLIGYMRALPTENGVKIGRVITLRHGMGHGKCLFDLALPEISKTLGCGTVHVHAQRDAVGFYLKMGFTPISEEFIEEGVVHIAMKKDLS